MERGLYRQTEERTQIVDDLDESIAALERAADGLRQSGARPRAHTALNVAQSAACLRSLLALDWKDEDAQQDSSQASDVGDRAA